MTLYEWLTILFAALSVLATALGVWITYKALPQTKAPPPTAKLKQPGSKRP